MIVGAVALGILVVLAVAFYGPIVRQAARVPGLARDVDRLTMENGQILVLAATLDSVVASYGQLRRMVGADVVPEAAMLAAATMPVAPAIDVVPAARRRRFEAGPSAPRHWPLDQRGFVTRGQVATDSTEEAHSGLDIAVPIGASVRAAGGGTVVEAGEDREYGLFVLLEHPDGYQSKYGHLSRVTVNAGQRVRAGEVIGRTGNTGRSSGPHLHFEILQRGAKVDPMTRVRENR